MEISTLGIDLSKTTFHVIGLGPRGEIVLRKKLSRKQLGDSKVDRSKFDSDGLTCTTCHSVVRLDSTNGNAGVKMGVPAVIVD